MTLLYLTAFACAITSGAVAKWKIGGIEYIYYLMAIVMFSYLYHIIKHRTIPLDSCTIRMLKFEIWAGFIVVLSMCGVMARFASEELMINLRYVPRQAFYLVFLPAILLMARDKRTGRIHAFVKKHINAVWFTVYFLHLLYRHDFSLFVQATFLLSYLTLLNVDKTGSVNPIHVILIILTPIAHGGEITNLLLRGAFLLYVLFYKKGKIINKWMGAGVVAMIAAMFILPFINPVYELPMGVNSLWRLFYWKDELTELIKTDFIGLGYGTAYATLPFLRDPFKGYIFGGPGYDPIHEAFVTGPHNSFISVAFRLGIIGIVLFFMLITQMWKSLRRAGLNSRRYAFIGILIIAGFNVGLESPAYLPLIILGLSCCTGLGVQKAVERPGIINKADIRNTTR